MSYGWVCTIGSGQGGCGNSHFYLFRDNGPDGPWFVQCHATQALWITDEDPEVRA